MSTDRLLGWGLERLGGKLLKALPTETPAPVRERLTQEFNCLQVAARQGRIDEQALGRLTRACTEALKDQRITPEELAHIDALATQLCASSAIRVEQ